MLIVTVTIQISRIDRLIRKYDALLTKSYSTALTREALSDIKEKWNFLQNSTNEDAILEEVENMKDAFVVKYTERLVQERVDPTILPIVDVKRFTGNYEDWMPFKQGFTALFMKREIQDSHRIEYLKLILSNKPLERVKQLLQNGENFGEIWNKLTEHYKNKRKIAEVHLRELMNLKKVEKINSVRNNLK